MPKINAFPAIEDGGAELRQKFKYGMWGPKIKDFELKHRTLSYCMMGMENNIFQVQRSAILLRYLWEQIRSAFKVSTQRKYDLFFDRLVKASEEKAREYRTYALKCYPMMPDCAADERMCKVIRDAYRHLMALSDKSGFGNKLVKNFDAQEYSKRNIME